MAPEVPATAADHTARLVISADSHVIEPHDLWVRELPSALRDRAPVFEPEGIFEEHPGAGSAPARLAAAASDGVTAEVLYPSQAMTLYALRDPELQQACFRVYNDWLLDYCSADPGRLVGVPAVCAYDIEAAIAEAERCLAAGLQGVLVWLAPDPAIPFSSLHYERFWDWAEHTGTPVSFHILTGFDFTLQLHDLLTKPYELYKAGSNTKIHGVADPLFDLIFSGVLERHPELKLVMAETDAGWLPFYAQRWDHYAEVDARTKRVLPLTKRPSEYIDESVWVTFVDDPVGGELVARHGPDRWMWSSDFPHQASTYPNSQRKIDEALGALPSVLRRKVLHDTVRTLYRFTL